MEMQAIDQTIFPSVLGKTKVFYCPRSLTSDNRTLSSFPIPRETYFDLLPALPLNNCIILYFTFIFSLAVFVIAAGQYFSILTGPDHYNVFFRDGKKKLYLMRR